MTNSSSNFDAFTFALEGNSLIEASAGTGKTYSIVNMFMRLLLNLGDVADSARTSKKQQAPVPASKILLMTFTNNSANELEERVIQKIEAFQATLLQVTQSLPSAEEQAEFINSLDLDTKQALIRIKEKFAISDDFIARSVLQILQEDRLKECMQLLAKCYNDNDFSIMTIDKFIIRAASLIDSEITPGNINTIVNKGNGDYKQDKTFILLKQSLTYTIQNELAFLTKKYQNKEQAYSIFNQLCINNLFKELGNSSTKGKRNSLFVLTTEDEYFYSESEKGLLYFIYNKIYGKISPEEIANLFYQYFAPQVQDNSARESANQSQQNTWQPQDIHLDTIYNQHQDLLTRIADVDYLTSYLKDTDNSHTHYQELNLLFNKLRVFFIYHIINPSFTYNITQKQFDLETYAVFLLQAIGNKEQTTQTKNSNLNHITDNSQDKVLNNQDTDVLDTIRQMFHFVFIDEFQDTSPLQFAILQRVFMNAYDHEKANKQARGVIMIGDPKQAIYAFRGADIFNYFVAQAHARKAPTMRYNYRSSQNFLEATNYIFTANSQFFALPQISYQPIKAGKPDNEVLLLKDEQGYYHETSPLTLVAYATSEKENEDETLNVDSSAADMAAETTKTSKKKKEGKSQGSSEIEEAYVVARLINHLVTLGKQKKLFIGSPIKQELTESKQGTKEIPPKLRPVTVNDIAVLVNKNQQAVDISNQLQRSFGINTTLKSDSILNEKWLLEDLLNTLLAIKDSTDDTQVRKFIYSSLSGLSFAQIEEVKAQPRVYMEIRQRLDKYKFLWQQQSLSAALDQLIKDSLLSAAHIYPKFYVENFTQLINLLLEKLNKPQNIEQVAIQISNSNFQEKFKSEYERLLTQSNKQQKLEEMTKQQESTQGRVQLMTMHASKGLEFPIVISLHEDKSSVRAATPTNNFFLPNFAGFYDFSQVGDSKFYLDTEIANRTRLLYVNCTRAKVAMFYLFTKQRYELVFDKAPITSKSTKEETAAAEQVFTNFQNRFTSENTLNPAKDYRTIAQSEEAIPTYLTAAYEKFIDNLRKQNKQINNPATNSISNKNKLISLDFYRQYFADPCNNYSILAAKAEYFLHLRSEGFFDMFPYHIRQALQQSQDGVAHSYPVCSSKEFTKSKITWEFLPVHPDYSYFADLFTEKSWESSSYSRSSTEQQRLSSQQEHMLAHTPTANVVLQEEEFSDRDLQLLTKAHAVPELKIKSVLTQLGKNTLTLSDPTWQELEFSRALAHYPQQSFTSLHKLYARHANEQNHSVSILKSSITPENVRITSDSITSQTSFNKQETLLAVGIVSSSQEQINNLYTNQITSKIDPTVTFPLPSNLDNLTHYHLDGNEDDILAQGSTLPLQSSEEINYAEEKQQPQLETYQAQLKHTDNILEFETWQRLLPRGADFGTKVHSYFERYHPSQDQNPYQQDSNANYLQRLFPVYKNRNSQVNKLIHDLIYTTQSQVLFTTENGTKVTVGIKAEAAGRINEWEFFVNAPSTSKEAANFRTMLKQFMKCLVEHGVVANEKLADVEVYASRLTGKVDLILLLQDYVVILDYKTNYLGTNPDDYTPQALAQTMQSTEYILQMYIYLAAVYTFCKQHIFTEQEELFMRVKFIGVYLFMRGLLYHAPHSQEEYGIYKEVAKQQLLEQLSKIYLGYISTIE